MIFLYYDEIERIRLNAKLNPSGKKCNLFENFFSPRSKIFCIKQKRKLHGLSLEYLKSRASVILQIYAQ